MMHLSISNKKEFQIYVIVYFILTVIGFLIGIISIVSITTGDWILINSLKAYPGLISIFLIFVALFVFLELILNPAYIETIINEKEIVIRTFSPNIRNGLRSIRMLRYKSHLKELILSTQDYNDYKLKIDNLGFRKLLILQRFNKLGIAETSQINISFLGIKKYSELILSIDRLRGKINLN
jgi:hypothetical protein